MPQSTFLIKEEFVFQHFDEEEDEDDDDGEDDDDESDTNDDELDTDMIDDRDSPEEVFHYYASLRRRGVILLCTCRSVRRLVGP